MAKYSFEFKLKVAQEYVAGQGGYGYLAQKYAIKNLEQVHRWVNSYREFGAAFLFRKRQNQNYSVQQVGCDRVYIKPVSCPIGKHSLFFIIWNREL